MNKKIFYILLVACMVLSLSVFSSSELKKIDRSVLKMFDEKESRIKVILKLNEDHHDKTEINRFKFHKSEVYKNFRYREVTREELEELVESAEVEQVFLSHDIKILLDNSTHQISSRQANALVLYGLNLTGTNMSVCVIDTGIDFTHNDLMNKNLSCIIDCYNKTCIENCSLLDDHGHGTHVAGIIGAEGNVNGVSPSVKLIGVKILNSLGQGSGNAIDLSRAIDYCVQRNVSVISLSLGTSTTYTGDCGPLMSPWTESINSAVVKNISVIVASGNSHSTTGISSPACIANSTAVGSIRKDDITINYNRNDQVYLLAPGVDIYSTRPGNNYAYDSGTSMSTPHVSGAFLMIYMLLELTNRSLRPFDIERVLKDTGKVVFDQGSGINYSRIDVLSALLSLDNVAPEVTLHLPTNDSKLFSRNVTIACSATDWSLAGISVFLWKDKKLLNIVNFSNLGNGGNLSYEFQSLKEGSYEYNCRATDNNSNTNFAETNLSFEVKLPMFGVLNSVSTIISDGVLDQIERPVLLKDIYDFAATREIENMVNSSEWVDLKNEVAQNNLDNNFSYFLGLVWTGAAVNNTQATVLFVDEELAEAINTTEEAYDDFISLSEYLQSNSAIACIKNPAMPNRSVDWSSEGLRNESSYPCVEIMSAESLHWSEYWNCSLSSGCNTTLNPSNYSGAWSGSVRTALDNGYRLGFVAGWDHNSTGSAANLYLGIRDPYDWSRQGIMDSIKRRHTWAAQDRIIVEFIMNNGSDEHIMGDSFVSASRHLLFNYSVSSAPGKKISYVNLFFDGVIINHTVHDHQNVSGFFELSLEDDNEHYVFIEAVQNNSLRSFTSPMYLQSLLVDYFPELINLSVDALDTNATFNLSLNTNSNCTLYITDPAMFSSSYVSPGLSRSHSIYVPGLSPETTYIYNLTCCDSRSKCTNNNVSEFNTLQSENSLLPLEQQLEQHSGSGSGGGSSLSNLGSIKHSSENMLVLDVSKVIRKDERMRFVLENSSFHIQYKGFEGSYALFVIESVFFREEIHMVSGEKKNIFIDNIKGALVVSVNNLGPELASITLSYIPEKVIQGDSQNIIYNDKHVGNDSGKPDFNQSQEPQESPEKNLNLVIFYLFIILLLTAISILALLILKIFYTIENSADENINSPKDGRKSQKNIQK